MNNKIYFLSLIFSILIIIKSKLIDKTRLITFTYNPLLYNYPIIPIYIRSNESNRKITNTYFMLLDINCYASWILSPEASDKTFITKISRSSGRYRGVLMEGDRGYANITIGNNKEKLDCFEMIVINRVNNGYENYHVLGLGINSLFHQYFSKSMNNSDTLLAIDFPNRIIIIGDKVNKIIEENKKIIGMCNINPHDIAHSLYGYRCTLNYIYINDKILYKNPLSYSRFETSYNYIHAPLFFFNFLKDFYFKGLNCVQRNDHDGIFYYCDENSYMNCGSIQFIFDNYVFELKKENLFVNENKQYKFIIILNQENNGYDWLFGNYFLQNYLIIFDNPNKSLLFIHSSYKEIPKFSEERYKSQKINLKFWLLILISILNILCSFLLLYVKKLY